jgi:hypothetical protein
MIKLQAASATPPERPAEVRKAKAETAVVWRTVELRLKDTKPASCLEDRQLLAERWSNRLMGALGFEICIGQPNPVAS